MSELTQGREEGLLKRRRSKSLLRTCIVTFLLYALFELVVSWAFDQVTGRLYAHVYPDIDTLLGYDQKVMNDDFSQIPKNKLRGCSYIVFDENHEILYATDDDIRREISTDELAFIPDSSADYYYDIYKNGEGGKWWIMEITYADEEWDSSVRNYALIDEQGNILEGNLFSDRDKISEREVGLLQGYYSQNCYIQKYSYMNADGKDRTIAFVAPSWNSDNGTLVYSYIDMLNLLEGAIKIVGLILASIILARLFRKSMVPLNEALKQYAATGTYDPEELMVPTEVRALESNFRILTEHVEKSNQQLLSEEQEKSRMIMNLSHDLKSPLTVIQGYAQALESRMVPEDQVDRYLQVLRRKADNSVRMINDLMQYATLEHPDYQMHSERTDMCELCRTCLVERYEEIENAGMEIAVDIPETPIWHTVDVRIFGGILDNLINNTIRYNKEGTLIFVYLESRNHQLHLRYADNGVGIPENIRDDLFKPFVIGNQARTSVKGTGIGMSIVKRAVDLHGGQIRLSDPRGTSFSTVFDITFPMDDSGKTV